MRNALAIICLLILGCSEKEPKREFSYDDHANVLIKQIIEQESQRCDCLMDIPTQSLITIRKEEMPLQYANLHKFVMNELGIAEINDLKKLERQSENFKPDRTILEHPNYKFMTGKVSEKIWFKECPKGVLFLTSPIFDKDFKKAVIIVDNGIFDCFPGIVKTYKLLNGKWIAQE